MTSEQLTESRFNALFAQFEEFEKEDKKYFIERDTFLNSFRSYITLLPKEYQLKVNKKMESIEIDKTLKDELCNMIKDILEDIDENYNKKDTFN